MLIATAICGVLAGLYIRYTPPKYQSSLLLQIGNTNTANKILDVENIYESEDISAEIEVLQSTYLMKRALAPLPLHVSIYNEGQFLAQDLYGKEPFLIEVVDSSSAMQDIPIYIDFPNREKVSVYAPSIGWDKEFNIADEIRIKTLSFKIHAIRWSLIEEMKSQVKENKIYFVVNNFDNYVNRLSGQLSVTLENSRANTVSISFVDHNPAKAVDIVTALSEEFKVYDVERKSQSARKVLDFINDQLDVVYNKLKVSEGEIQKFRENNGMSTSSEFTNIYLGRLSTFESSITDLELQLSVLKKMKGSLEKKDQEQNLNELIGVISGTEYEGTLRIFSTSLKALIEKRQNLLYDLTEDHDAVKSLDQQIETQRTLLLQSVNSTIKELEGKKKDLIDKSGEIEGKFLGIPEKEIEFARLQRMLSIDQKFFDLLAEKRTEYSISEKGFVSQNIVLEEASRPTSPMSPSKMFVFLVFVVASLLLCLSILIVKYLFYNHITSLDELERLVGPEISILGVIPKYKKNIPTSQLVINQQSKSVIAEAFRAVRSSISFISRDVEVPLITITSTVSGEGKTFAALNLGGILALSGKKCILLDLDLRKPKIHLGFGTSNDKGMSVILGGQCDYHECVQHSEIEGLDYITAGPIPPNPAELIINGKLDELLVELKKNYDFIIIDNPPVGMVSDGLTVMRQADVPIYVLRADYSKREFVRNLERVKYEYGIDKLSVILNAVDLKAGIYQYSYGYGYGYGGYYEEE